MCLQTEEIIENEEEENKSVQEVESNPVEVLTFDEFIKKIEIPLPKAKENYQFGLVEQALNKINEIENIKKEVKDRENTKFKRVKASIKIQAWARGVLARRKHIPPLIEIYKERLRQRKIKEVGERIKRQWAPYAILNALRK